MNENVPNGKGEGNHSGDSPGATERSNPLPGVGESERESVAKWIEQGRDSGSDPRGASGEAERSSSSRRRGSRSRSRKDGSGDRTSHERTGSNAAGGDNGRAAASESGRETKPGADEQKRSPEVVSRVEKPRKIPLTVLPGGKKADSLSEEFIAELWRMLYQIPHLAGYDDPANPWWPLHPHEASALASPSARILARMSPAEQELFSRFADPIALVVTAVAITSFRAEMTREYVKAQKVVRATEARRAGLSRATAASDAERDRRNNGESPPRSPADAEERSSASHEFIKDSFGES